MDDLFHDTQNITVSCSVLKYTAFVPWQKPNSMYVSTIYEREKNKNNSQ